jgi:plasmid maintenance system antidote protein VapI
MNAADGYLQRAGATFRAIINDLKRNEEAAAQDLGVEVALIHAIVAGERAIPTDLVERACRTWPVNQRDFFPIHDDVPDGLLVMRAEQSAASSRVFQRGGHDYYEYRDTAMSRVAMIRPEWIKMLHAVDDDDARNPTVRWNNGHFLYQFTYFIGAVNYYYEWQGRRFCAPMVTGDSVFGLPFARHSFACRDPRSGGLILALTYGGRLLGDAQHELGVLGCEAAARFALPVASAPAAQAALLRLHAGNGGHTATSLAAAAGLPRERVAALLAGDEAADFATLARLAEALRVAPRELLPLLPDTDDGVVIVKAAAAASWAVPDEGRPAYRFKQLAGSTVTPFARSLDVEVLAAAGDGYHPLESSLHQYGYNHGGAPVELLWELGGQRRQTTLRPGDSFYVKPFVAHGFRRLPGGDPGPSRVLLLRVGGKTVGDATLEISAIGGQSLHRVVAESMRWYDAEPSASATHARK